MLYCRNNCINYMRNGLNCQLHWTILSRNIYCQIQIFVLYIYYISLLMNMKPFRACSVPCNKTVFICLRTCLILAHSCGHNIDFVWRAFCAGRLRLLAALLASAGIGVKVHWQRQAGAGKTVCRAASEQIDSALAQTQAINQDWPWGAKLSQQ